MALGAPSWPKPLRRRRPRRLPGRRSPSRPPSSRNAAGVAIGPRQARVGGQDPHGRAARGAGLTSRSRSVAQALELCGLARRADVLVQNLSGGERRRLDLAVATLSQPDLLLLDEPTAGMDPEGRHATWQLIGDLREQGATIVLTTHYLEEAESLADHLAIMHRGRIAAAGTVSEIVAGRPSTLPFGLDSRWTPSDLPFDGLGPVREGRGGRVTLTTNRLQKDATRLLNWAEEHDLVLDQFTARPASLEEAFIGIAGDHGTRDEEEETTAACTG
ncbi:ATP-binding cassette domain-containing protein [Streptomyces sp. NPDC054961]